MIDTIEPWTMAVAFVVAAGVAAAATPMVVRLALALGVRAAPPTREGSRSAPRRACWSPMARRRLSGDTEAARVRRLRRLRDSVADPEALVVPDELEVHLVAATEPSQQAEEALVGVFTGAAGNGQLGAVQRHDDVAHPDTQLLRLAAGMHLLDEHPPFPARGVFCVVERDAETGTTGRRSRR